MSQEKLQAILQSVSEFPTLPTVIARVMQLLDDPYSSASDITELISKDQAMTFRILKMANSAYYGFPRAIATVTESIVLLGFATVRNLILTTMMYNFDQMWIPGEKRKIKKNPPRLDQQVEWKHAVATAIAARELLIRQGLSAQEHLGYLAGLMHDVGKIFFYHYLHEDYMAVLEKVKGREAELPAAEAEMLGADHGQVAAWIVDRWNLPSEIVEPIAFHHAPGKAVKQRQLAEVLAEANLLAHQVLDLPQSGPAVEGVSDDELKKLEGIRGKIMQELKQTEALMRR